MLVKEDLRILFFKKNILISCTPCVHPGCIPQEWARLFSFFGRQPGEYFKDYRLN